jgi:hypothetical protein
MLVAPIFPQSTYIISVYVRHAHRREFQGNLRTAIGVGAAPQKNQKIIEFRTQDPDIVPRMPYAPIITNTVSQRSICNQPHAIATGGSPPCHQSGLKTLIKMGFRISFT